MNKKMIMFSLSLSLSLVAVNCFGASADESYESLMQGPRMTDADYQQVRKQALAPYGAEMKSISESYQDGENYYLQSYATCCVAQARVLEKLKNDPVANQVQIHRWGKDDRVIYGYITQFGISIQQYNQVKSLIAVYNERHNLSIFDDSFLESRQAPFCKKESMKSVEWLYTPADLIREKENADKAFKQGVKWLSALNAAEQLNLES